MLFYPDEIELQWIDCVICDYVIQHSFFKALQLAKSLKFRVQKVSAL